MGVKIKEVTRHELELPSGETISLRQVGEAWNGMHEFVTEGKHGNYKLIVRAPNVGTRAFGEILDRSATWDVLSVSPELYALLGIT